MTEKIRVTSHDGPLPPRDGFLESEDYAYEVRIPSEVVDWTFKNKLWDRINAACATGIDEYEGVWLDPTALIKAAEIIRQTLTDERDLSKGIIDSMSEAMGVLDACANRGVRVMFSL
jgi:hypothetical protein